MATPEEEEEAECPGNFTRKPSGCYHVSVTTAFFYDALEACTQVGNNVHLAEPDTEQVRGHFCFMVAVRGGLLGGG